MNPPGHSFSYLNTQPDTDRTHTSATHQSPYPSFPAYDTSFAGHIKHGSTNGLRFFLRSSTAAQNGLRFFSAVRCSEIPSLCPCVLFSRTRGMISDRVILVCISLGRTRSQERPSWGSSREVWGRRLLHAAGHSLANTGSRVYIMHTRMAHSPRVADQRPLHRG